MSDPELRKRFVCIDSPHDRLGVMLETAMIALKPSSVALKPSSVAFGFVPPIPPARPHAG